MADIQYYPVTFQQLVSYNKQYVDEVTAIKAKQHHHRIKKVIDALKLS